MKKLIFVIECQQPIKQQAAHCKLDAHGNLVWFGALASRRAREGATLGDGPISHTNQQKSRNRDQKNERLAASELYASLVSIGGGNWRHFAK